MASFRRPLGLRLCRSQSFQTQAAVAVSPLAQTEVKTSLIGVDVYAVGLRVFSQVWLDHVVAQGQLRGHIAERPGRA